MKNLLGTTFLSLLVSVTLSQSPKIGLQGKVYDAKTGIPIPKATIWLGKTFVIANQNGVFELTVSKQGKFPLIASSVGYVTYETKVDISQNVQPIEIPLTPSTTYLQPLEIRSIRASENSPFTKLNISKEQIAEANLGQDLPIILQNTPSAVVNSDAGNGVGYTGIHIRGTDLTRINVTMNGIPYNDAESLGTYFVDLPDFASSLQSIQIQRGVGTSSNGAGAFGATINLQTNEVIDKPYAESNNAYGSFNTLKTTIKAGTGLIDGHYTADVRLSKISSDGYIDRATSDLRSLAFSTAYIDGGSTLRLNVFSGKEKTYQAWYGVQEDSLATHRTLNIAGQITPTTFYNNETDNYQQDHYQLFYNQTINKKWCFNTAAFLTYGRGYFEEYIVGDSLSNYGLPPVVIKDTAINNTDLVRQRWLDNYFYGQIASLEYKGNNDQVTLGGGWNRYSGKHYALITWANIGVPNDYQYYNYPALKEDQNIYVKWQHNWNSSISTFTDLQYRHIYHRMTGFEGDPSINISKSFDFLNPKVGISYTNNGWNNYLSFALGQKEPNRDDFQSGITNNAPPRPEKLYDIELGSSKKWEKAKLGATFFYMDYTDQLALTGKLNDDGNSIRINVPKSYRVGIELEGAVSANKWLNISCNIALSQNKVKAFSDSLTDYATYLQTGFPYRNTDLSFSPSVIASYNISFIPIHSLNISLIGRYVGSQYLDNTQNKSRSLSDYFVQDARLHYTVHHIISKEISLIAQVNNVFNRLYESTGNSYPYLNSGQLINSNYYYPMATTNYMIGVNIKW